MELFVIEFPGSFPTEEKNCPESSGDRCLSVLERGEESDLRDSIPVLRSSGMFFDEFNNRRRIVQTMYMPHTGFGDERDFPTQFSISIRQQAGIFIPRDPLVGIPVDMQQRDTRLSKRFEGVDRIQGFCKRVPRRSSCRKPVSVSQPPPGCRRHFLSRRANFARRRRGHRRRCNRPLSGFRAAQL